MNRQKHIISDPTIMFGKPVIRETRIPIDLVLEKLGNGESIPQLLEAYPKATEADFYACLQFASDIVKNEIVYAQAS